MLYNNVKHRFPNQVTHVFRNLNNFRNYYDWQHNYAKNKVHNIARKPAAGTNNCGPPRKPSLPKRVRMLECWLQYLFFFHKMYKKVPAFHINCATVQYLQKKKIELIQSQKLSRIWEIVAGDLFWPVPVSNHVIVV